ncbi:toll/interleukin-1 receptor domain-containing protein [Actinomadura craniellae]|nr:toll/interleukin-1 receptor domain-containing protein [Actinomadura craniellae]
MLRQITSGQGGYHGVLKAVASEVLTGAGEAPSPADPERAGAVRPAFGAAPDLEAVPARSTRTSEPSHGSTETIAISYVGADLPRAEWIAELLMRHGLPARLVKWNVGAAEPLREALGRAWASGERVVALLSRDYLSPPALPPGSLEEITAILRDAGAPRSEGAPRLIKVRIDDGDELPEALAATTISLYRLRRSALGRLLQELGSAAQEVAP